MVFMGYADRMLRRAQGAYYLVTGLWPVVHFRSFTVVAGPKPDRFQTQVTGALFAAIGLTLLVGEPASRATRVLSGASAAAAIGMTTAYRRQIRDVFWADAAVESVFLARALRR
jgi:hypothetical protein